MPFAYLFACRPSRGYVTFEDVRDAYRLAATCTCNTQKDAMYHVFGLDRNRVELYYPIVEQLEYAWTLDAETDATMETKKATSKPDLRAKAFKIFEMGPIKITWNV